MASMRRTATAIAMILMTIVAAGAAVGAGAIADGAHDPWGPTRPANRDYKKAEQTGRPFDLLARADGTQIMVYQMQYASGASIEIATRPLAGKWAQPRVVATFQYGAGYSGHAVASDAGAIAVGYVEFTGSEDRSMVVTIDEDGEVGEPIELERNDYSASVWMYGNARGDLLAIVGSEPTAYAKPRGGDWSEGADVPEWEVFRNQGDFAVDPEGRAIAVWRRDPGEVVWSELDGESWSDPRRLANGPGQIQELKVAENRSGDLSAVWSRDREDSADRIQVIQRSDDGQWGTVHTVNAPRRHPDEVDQPDVAVDASGAATVTWETPNQYGVLGPAITATQRSDGTWASPATVLDLCDVFTLRLAMNSHGDTVTSCQRGEGSYSWYIAAVRTAAGEWEAQRDLTGLLCCGNGAWLNLTDAVVTERGEATVAFRDVDSNAIWTRVRAMREGGSAQAGANSRAEGGYWSGVTTRSRPRNRQSSKTTANAPRVRS